MGTHVRRKTRRAVHARYTLSWVGGDARQHSAAALGVDISEAGLRVECVEGVEVDTTVLVEAADGHLSGHATVRHCTLSAGKFHIGMVFGDDVQRVVQMTAPVDSPDYYEVMQISPGAEPETVRRVYRIMASRFHPDNPETGDVEKFLLLETAYQVLSDPARRAEYDAGRQDRSAQPDPIFELKDFVVGVEAEINRRLGILALLYNQKRQDPEDPGISLLDLEKRMAIPREHLEFTLWYLRARCLVVPAEDSNYTLTVEGVDYLEANAPKNTIVHRLLNGASAPRPEPEPAPAPARPRRSAYPALPNPN